MGLDSIFTEGIILFLVTLVPFRREKETVTWSALAWFMQAWLRRAWDANKTYYHIPASYTTPAEPHILSTCPHSKAVRAVYANA